MPPPAKINVLVIDDSAFARKVIREIISTDPAIGEVQTARDGEEGLAVCERSAPHVVICDLMMPKMDGVAFVRRQMEVRPVPILILSSATQEATEVVEALQAGAFDMIQKPSALATDELRTIRASLLEKIRAAAGAPASRLTVTAPGPLVAAHPSARRKILCVGTSTGGPQALRRLMPRLPADFPLPVAVVLHMPVGYTALYAEKLNELCALSVKEAADGDPVIPGRILVAPAGKHLTFRSTPTGIVAQLAFHPVDKLHRPSVDVLFQSAAQTYGSGVIAVVLTGMGDDGQEGSAWVKAEGGTVLTETEKSCIIYGMPRSVVEAGLSDKALSLEEMADAIISLL